MGACVSGAGVSSGSLTVRALQFPSNYSREVTREEYEAYCAEYQIAVRGAPDCHLAICAYFVVVGQPYFEDAEVEEEPIQVAVKPKREWRSPRSCRAALTDLPRQRWLRSSPRLPLRPRPPPARQWCRLWRQARASCVRSVASPSLRPRSSRMPWVSTMSRLVLRAFAPGRCC